MNDAKKPGGLCLTRRPQEGQNSVVINDHIEVQVIEIKGNMVRLRFVSQRGEWFKIFRKELINDPRT